MNHGAMLRISRILFAAGALAITAPSRELHAQSARADLCASIDAAASGLLDYARDLAQPADSALAVTAVRYGISPVPASQVSFNTDDKTCARAARRLNQESGRKGKTDAPVYIIQVGTDKNKERYIVVDPAEHAGEYAIAMVFDAHFKLIASFTH
jgi:hypothetical protein